jgi:hypothetical protein
VVGFSTWLLLLESVQVSYTGASTAAPVAVQFYVVCAVEGRYSKGTKNEGGALPCSLLLPCSVPGNAS